MGFSRGSIIKFRNHVTQVGDTIHDYNQNDFISIQNHHSSFYKILLEKSITTLYILLNLNFIREKVKLYIINFYTKKI